MEWPLLNRLLFSNTAPARRHSPGVPVGKGDAAPFASSPSSTFSFSLNVSCSLSPPQTPWSIISHFPVGKAEGTSPPAQLALTTTGLSARPNPQAFLSTRKWELVCVRTSLTVQRHICSRIETVSALPLEQQRSLIP